MFTSTGTFYDDLYATKDYKGEAETIIALVNKHCPHRVDSLLDVGCGTGKHLTVFARHYKVAGVDLDERLLKLAKARLPNVELTHCDMCTLQLHRRFDAITCLYGSIAYLRTRARLRQTMVRLAAHVHTGGVVVIQPWYRSADRCPRSQVRQVERPNVKISRMSHAEIDSGDQALVNVHYLIGTETGVEHVEELHELGIFSHDDHMESLEQAGFEARMRIDSLGPGADLYIGKLR